MFFNEDIFFRNGSLALVWMAGNDNFKNKKGRHRGDYVAVLKSNMTTLCETLRNLFPQMGTAHGIPLKKMATLAKGMGVIYLIKMEEFAKEVHHTAHVLKRPVTVLDIQNEEKARTKKSKLLVAPVNNPADRLNNEDDQMDKLLHQYDENFGFPSPRHGGLPSPIRSGLSPFTRFERTPSPGPNLDEDIGERRRSSRKRKRGERTLSDNYDDVLRKLKEAENIDPRAHCLRECDSAMLGQDLQQHLDFGDLDLGNGMDLLAEEFADNFAQPVEPGADNIAPVPPSPTEDYISALGPPSNFEGDLRSNVQETPVGAVIVPKNYRGRRNEGQREADITVMELPNIDVDAVRRVRRARRRLQLKVDTEICITFRDMMDRVDHLKSKINMEELGLELIRTRAQPKSLWKVEAWKRKTPVEIISASGRLCGSTVLNDMVAAIMKGQLGQPHRFEIQRSEEDQTTHGGVSLNFAEGRRSAPIREDAFHAECLNNDINENDVQVSSARISINSVAGAGRSRHEFSPSPPLENIVEAQEEFAAYDNGCDQPQPFEPELEIPAQGEDPFQVPDSRPRKHSRRSEQAVLARDLEERKTFEELYPPANYVRRQASKAFLSFLKMQGMKIVSLVQEDSFGQIYIEKIQKV